MSPTSDTSAAEDRPVSAKSLPLRHEKETLPAIPFGLKSAPLGICWEDLTVRAVRPKPVTNENLYSQLHPWHILARLRYRPADDVIIQGSSGSVRPGEMLLVTGSSPSDNSAFLNILANRRAGFTQIQGDVRYGTMSPKEFRGYRKWTAACTDEKLFWPSLTVDQTMELAMRLGNPLSRTGTASKQELEDEKNWILDAMGISHLKTCRVGDDDSPGISKREKKLLALAETLVLGLRCSFLFLDNATSGLDSETVSECMRVVRDLTTTCGLSTIVTLPSPTDAGKDLYDKFLVLDKRSVVLYGQDAHITTPSAGSSTQTSSLKDNRLCSESEDARQLTEAFRTCHTTRSAVWLERSGHTLRRLFIEVKFSLLQEFQTQWHDRGNLAIGQTSNLIQSLTAGSLFFNAPQDTSGFPKITGALFFSMLFHSLIPLKTIPEAFQHRATAVKYGALSRRSFLATHIAVLASDMAIIAFQASLFAVSFYFLVGLRSSAQAFFTYWMILVSMSHCLTSLFRFVGCASKTLDGASKAAGLISFATLVCCGYVVAEPQMLSWISWFFWINPTGQAYDALVANEFHGKIIQCVGSNVAPTGPGYEDAKGACIGIGGAPRSGGQVTGDQYLSSQSYDETHIWRNVGIMWAYWLVFSSMTLLVRISWRPDVPSSSRPFQVPREAMVRRDLTPAIDEESRSVPAQKCTLSGSVSVETEQRPIFSWKGVTLSKTIDGKSSLVLDNLHGCITPGTLTAFISPSGPASTTLLKILAQHDIEDSMHVGGVASLDKQLLERCPHPSQWMGYSHPTSTYDPFSTVREALRFSALLRRGGNASRKEETLEDVEAVLDILALWEVADHLVGSNGEGLTPLQNRKVSLGMELVAGPAILFVEDPTADLDPEAALEIMHVLRRVVTVGTAICISLEQPSPSSMLLPLVDVVLALTHNGKQAYFGPTEGQTVVEGLGSLLSSTDTTTVLSELEIASSQVQDLTSSGYKLSTRSPPRQYSASIWEQVRVVTKRATVSMYRNTNYINNRVMLHVVLGLFNGFCFFHLPKSAAGVQLRQSTIFNFIFVAPGVTSQQQAYFAERRRLYEAREKHNNMYGTFALWCSLILPEIPYLCFSALLYFACWYYTVGLPGDPERTGAIFLTMVLYELLYTSAGQLIVACVSDATTAALLNPLILGNFVAFCGILVPYAQMVYFWRSWFYYLNPFTYFIGSLLAFSVADMELSCSASEAVTIDPADGLTCGRYLAAYLSDQGSGRRLLNPEATTGCQICPYRTGTDWLKGRNIEGLAEGWRDIGVVAAFAIFFYASIFVVMKFRSRNRTVAVRRVLRSLRQ